MTMTSMTDRLAALRENPDCIRKIISTVLRDREESCKYSPTDPHRPLATLIEMAGYSPVLVGECFTALSDASQRLILRMSEPETLESPPLRPRRSADTDEVAYLVQGVNGYDFLARVIASPPAPELPGLTDIVLTLDLTAVERANRILALHPDAADVCSSRFATPSEAREIERFYIHTMAEKRLWAVIDRQTNTIMSQQRDEDMVRAHCQVLNEFPDVADRIVSSSQRHDAIQAMMSAQEAECMQERRSLFHELVNVSRAWREQRYLIGQDPYKGIKAA